MIRKHRVDIHPVAPDSGIEKGFVFLYGYYIAPPYALEVRGCSTFINGVPIYPELKPNEPTPDTTSAPQEPPDEWFLVSAHLSDLTMRAGGGYWEDIERGESHATAEQRAESLLRADPLVVSVERLHGQGLRVKAGKAMLRGKLMSIPTHEIVYDWVRPRHGERRRSTPIPPSLGMAVLTESIVRRVLEAGQCEVRSFGLSGAKPAEYARRVGRAMLQTELPEREFWQGVCRAAGYSEALAFFANRDAAAGTWRQLAVRLGEQE
ncbi:MAG: hypothetical protein R6X13_04795 [bacterium]